ncbi:MAG: protein-export chaperone SecB [Rickettsiales bacterium]
MSDAPKTDDRPQLRVNAQYVKDLSFENPHAPASLARSESAPKISIDVGVDVRQVADHSFEVTLTIRAGAENAKKEPVFLVELAYAGVFTVDSTDKERRDQLLAMYCPSLLFPFARQIIADAVSQGGFPALMLEPIDFSRLYAKRKPDEEEEEVGHA